MTMNRPQRRKRRRWASGVGVESCRCSWRAAFRLATGRAADVTKTAARPWDFAALNDSRTRAGRITVLSQQAEEIRNSQCHRIKVRNARLHVSNQKVKNLVAQIEAILQERFGALKSFFLERKMRVGDKQ